MVTNGRAVGGCRKESPRYSYPPLPRVPAGAAAESPGSGGEGIGVNGPTGPAIPSTEEYGSHRGEIDRRRAGGMTRNEKRDALVIIYTHPRIPRRRGPRTRKKTSAFGERTISHKARESSARSQ